MTLQVNNLNSNFSNQKLSNQAVGFNASSISNSNEGNTASFGVNAKNKTLTLPIIPVLGAVGVTILGAIYAIKKHNANNILNNVSNELNTKIKNYLTQIDIPIFESDTSASMLAKLFDSSAKDTLTGLHNRRYFFAHLKTELQQAIDKKEDFIIGMFDNDYFKSVNEALGHDGGDTFIKTVGGILKDVFGEESISRFGGEEFALKLPGKTSEEAMAMFKEYQKQLKINETLKGLVPKYLESLKKKMAELEAKAAQKSLSLQDQDLLNSYNKWLAHVESHNGFTTSIGFINIKSFPDVSVGDPNTFYVNLADTALVRKKNANVRNSITEATKDDFDSVVDKEFEKRIGSRKQVA